MTLQERPDHDLRGFFDARDAGSGADGDLDELFASSPSPVVRTSAAAVAGLDLALVGLVTVPFAPLVGVASLAAVLALVVSVVGLARSSRRGVTGSLMSALGLVGALAVAGLVGLRYAGLDTTLPTGAGDAITHTVAWLASLVPAPR